MFFAELETQPLVAHHARKDCGAAQRLRPVLGMRFGQFGQRDNIVVVSTRNDQIDVFTPQDLEHTRAKSLGLLGRGWREENSVKRPETWIIADARSGEQAQRFSSSLEDAQNELRHLAASPKERAGSSRDGRLYSVDTRSSQIDDCGLPSARVRHFVDDVKP